MNEKTLITATDVWKRYKARGRWVLQGVNLEISAGQLVSISGENGSGKSTLLSVLAGETAPTRGTVSRISAIGYCPQSPALYPRLTVDEHFALYGQAANLPSTVVEQARISALERLAFDKYGGTQSRSLSGGTRAKLSLSLSLLGDPAVLILDEPYAAFDLSSYEAFWDLVTEQRSAGRAVVIVSHLELDTERFDRRWTIHGGKLADVV